MTNFASIISYTHVQCIVTWNTLNMYEETSETQEHVQQAYTIVFRHTILCTVLEIHLLPWSKVPNQDFLLLQKDTLRLYKSSQ